MRSQRTVYLLSLKNRRGDRIPPLSFPGELARAPARQSVVFRLPIVLCRSPIRLDEPVELHPVQRWIERSLLDAQDRIRDRLDAAGDRETVIRTGGERAQDQQGQRAVQQFTFQPYLAAQR